MLGKGTSGWVRACFLKALVTLRNNISASMPLLVPSMSDVMRSSEASLRMYRWCPYVGQEARMWSRVCEGSPHGHD